MKAKSSAPAVNLNPQNMYRPSLPPPFALRRSVPSFAFSSLFSSLFPTFRSSHIIPHPFCSLPVIASPFLPSSSLLPILFFSKILCFHAAHLSSCFSADHLPPSRSSLLLPHSSLLMTFARSKFLYFYAPRDASFAVILCGLHVI